MDISHEYFGVDYEIIWDVATNYLPENKIQIDRIIDKENNIRLTLKTACIYISNGFQKSLLMVLICKIQHT
jgi:hypothetical protein